MKKLSYGGGVTEWLVTDDIVQAKLSTSMFKGYEYTREFLYKDFNLNIVDTMLKAEDNNQNAYELVYHIPNDKNISILQDQIGIKVASKQKMMFLTVQCLSDLQSYEILFGDKLPLQFIQKISKSYNKLEECKTVVFRFKTNVQKEFKVKTDISISNKRKIFILGSCVSRDAFELSEPRDFEIVNYLARTSIASAFYDKTVDGFDLSAIKSNFQRRMVDNDLKKTTLKNLISSKFEYLIIDLVDERFGLLQNNLNYILTFSSEFKDNIEYDQNEWYHIPSGSDKFYDLWTRGWDNFMKFAEENDFANKILLNKVYWSSTDSNGEHVFKNYQGWIDNNNKYLERLYSYIESNYNNIIILDYPKDCFRVDKNHKWGIQPYHFHSNFYIEFLKKLAAL